MYGVRSRLQRNKLEMALLVRSSFATDAAGRIGQRDLRSVDRRALRIRDISDDGCGALLRARELRTERQRYRKEE